MNLKDWQDNGWLKQHTTDKQEIANLLSIVERDLNDAGNTTVSSDWRFGIAYNAALKLCTIVLYAQGYRPENTLAHYRTIMALKVINPTKWTSHSAYLNACRMRRNTLEYELADIIPTRRSKQTALVHSSIQGRSTRIPFDTISKSINWIIPAPPE